MDEKDRVREYLKRRITRRQAVKAGGLAAIGLIFSKPLIDTISPRPVFANYEPPNGGEPEGCTPGFWKTHNEDPFWPQPPFKGTPLTFAFTFNRVPDPENVNALGSQSFQMALEFPGGSSLQAKARIMLRAAAAAYLNALTFALPNPEPHYPLTPAQVVALVDAELLGGDATSMIILAENLDGKNNLGECDFLLAGPLSRKA